MNNYPNLTLWLYSQLTRIIGIGSFLLGFVLLVIALRKKAKVLHNIWFLLCLAIGGWNFGYYITMIPGISKINALIASRISHASGILIVPLFLQFSALLRSEYFKNRKFILPLCYIVCLLFAGLSLTPFVVTNIVPKLSLQYYPVGKVGYALYVLIFISWVVYANVMLIKAAKEGTGVERNQIKYFLFGTIPGFIGGFTCFPLIFGIKFPPYASILIIIYLFSTPYAILKYRLMDINIALTRAGIFIFVYALVLGIPFWLGYVTKAWLPSTALAVVLATVGPFIYQRLRKRAEDLILKDQRRYQHALRELSRTMTRIRDLDKLLKMIVLTVIDTVKVNYAGVYLKDEEYSSYRLKHYFPKREGKGFPELVPLESSLIKGLYTQRRPLMPEEVGSSTGFSLESGLVIPCFMEDELLGFLVMGAKPDNQIYTADDILVFETLSYSTSLAIENCRFWKEIEDRQRKARLQEMDTYSYSLAHEIDNPMQVVIGQTNLLKKYLLKEINLAEEKQEEMEESFDFIR